MGITSLHLASADKMKTTSSKKLIAVDLFSGCGGLSEGIREAGFSVALAIEKDKTAAACYRMNHSQTQLITGDIRRVTSERIKEMLGTEKIHLLAGCPPCQGFSSVRRLNKTRSVTDKRNRLILDFLRLVKKLRPTTIMFENVPGLRKYYLFGKLTSSLRRQGYHIDWDVVDIAAYGIPQRRVRLVLVGSMLGPIKIASANDKRKTVRDAIGKLGSVTTTRDPLHKIVGNHSNDVRKMITKIPKNGGSRIDLPKGYQLKCHKRKNVGFKDIYGRLSWDAPSSTITGGCLNPSKGRFLHPEADRVITPREAALLQSFPRDYKFSVDIPKGELALLIGNALPPEFSRIQSLNILNHIKQHNA